MMIVRLLGMRRSSEVCDVGRVPVDAMRSGVRDIRSIHDSQCHPIEAASVVSARPILEKSSLMWCILGGTNILLPPGAYDGK
jgi:hypothetical protein